MGMLMDFYAGDEEKIVQAICTPATGINPADVSVSHSDFSFRISPDDLAILTDVAMSLTSTKGQHFPDAWAQNLFMDKSGESAVERMARDGVELFASIREDQAPLLTRLWTERMNQEQGIAVPEDTMQLEQAVAGLCRLCKVAQDQELPVLFSWCL